MKVSLPEERDRLPALSAVFRFDQSKQGREIRRNSGCPVPRKRSRPTTVNPIVSWLLSPTRTDFDSPRPDLQRPVWVAMNNAPSAGLMPRPCTCTGPSSTLDEPPRSPPRAQRTPTPTTRGAQRPEEHALPFDAGLDLRAENSACAADCCPTPSRPTPGDGEGVGHSRPESRPRCPRSTVAVEHHARGPQRCAGDARKCN